MTALDGVLEDAARSSAEPASVRIVFETLAARPGGFEPPDDVAFLLAGVAGASRSLARLLLRRGADAVAACSAVDADGLAAATASFATVSSSRDRHELKAAAELSYLQIAAADLSGLAQLEEVGLALSGLADAVLQAAFHVAGAQDLAVIAMGKHGAAELNYASDVDVVFVASSGSDLERATSLARSVLALAGECYRMDTDLRPEGRNGALVRSLDSYVAYWERWAEPWEFQALLKARPSAGDAALGEEFARAANSALWSRRFDAEALDELRQMKGRVEEEVARRGLSDRELKRGRGGLRDIEFAVQLLQLVHGRNDAAIRVGDSLSALLELARAGYIDAGDAALLSLAYRLLRTTEHRLQLVEGAQVHTLPPPGPARDQLARVLGFGEPAGAARTRSERLEVVLARYQSSVRSIHERLYFRPLLEVFGSSPRGTGLSPFAAEERLAAFGFKETARTKEALLELTRGLTRSSRLMSQLLPVLLGWLSETPDPDLGLLGLRNLAGLPHQRDVVVASFRDSPELARRLCVLFGTGRRLSELARGDPSLALRIGDDAELAPLGREELLERAVIAAGSRGGARSGLQRLSRSEVLRIAAGELVGVNPPGVVARELANLADGVLSAALSHSLPRVAFGVVAMGRLGGCELAYGSDLDVVFVHDAKTESDVKEAERVANSIVGLLNGSTPAERVFTLDTSLRPEGKKGPLARSLAAHAAYHERWIAPWERQALVRARPLAGDEGLLSSYMELVTKTAFERPFGPEELRQIRRLKARAERERIPAGEDPQFHLKLGKGSLADIEWTVQLLQLRHATAATNTEEALELLCGAGAIDAEDAAVLREALGFLNSTRGRWHLVGNYIAAGGGIVNPAGSDSLPQSKEALARLCRSLGKPQVALREEYRRVTRRARKVVERRFYGI